MKDNIQTSAEYLANLCLENAGNKTDYTDEDLLNVTIIYQEVFSNKMFEHHAGKITNAQMAKLAEESGKSLRQTILLFTGKDMHEVAKRI